MQTLLPLALAFIMFYLGMTLVLDDFRHVARRPRAIVVGLIGQLLLVPLAGFFVAKVSGLDTVMAVGVMVLVACPGGVSSGLLTHLARGDTALSISLTAVTSLVSVVTLPLVVGFSYQYFLSNSLAVELPLASMVRGIFMLTTVPVLAGMVLRWRFPQRVGLFEKTGGRIATSLFVLIVLATFWDQRQLLSEQIPRLGPAMFALNVLILGAAYALARQTRIERTDRIAVVTECGLQNSALGIYVCLQWLAVPAMSAPSVVYALLMNAGGLVFVMLMRGTAKL